MPGLDQASRRFEARKDALGPAFKYRLYDSGRPLSYAEVLDLWQDDLGFLDFYLSIFRNCGCDSYVWETPALSRESSQQGFEFVIQRTSHAWARPDQMTFADYFDTERAPDGIVSFANLGGDALLVVPSPYSRDADYSDLPAFFRNAPLAQQRALWREVASQAKRLLSDRPFWLSVAGGGVAWLHVRLDKAPKYYRYRPYTRAG
ncbi:MAG: hypothetical protein RIC87_11005 [Kiloniellales bacterium]